MLKFRVRSRFIVYLLHDWVATRTTISEQTTSIAIPRKEVHSPQPSGKASHFDWNSRSSYHNLQWGREPFYQIKENGKCTQCQPPQRSQVLSKSHRHHYCSCQNQVQRKYEAKRASCFPWNHYLLPIQSFNGCSYSLFCW